MTKIFKESEQDSICIHLLDVYFRLREDNKLAYSNQIHYDHYNIKIMNSLI